MTAFVYARTIEIVRSADGAFEGVKLTIGRRDEPAHALMMSTTLKNEPSAERLVGMINVMLQRDIDVNGGEDPLYREMEADASQA